MSAALAPRAIAVGARATRKPTKKNFRHALRAVVDSETPQGDQTKPMQVQRPTRDAVTLRPAGGERRGGGFEQGARGARRARRKSYV